jgi:hypothetical protein
MATVIGEIIEPIDYASRRAGGAPRLELFIGVIYEVILL